MCILIYDTIGFVQIRGKCHFGVVQPVGICHYSDIMKWLMEMIYIWLSEYCCQVSVNVQSGAMKTESVQNYLQLFHPRLTKDHN